MTETELINRLRESIVLHGPDAWRSNGYLQDAQSAGLTLVTALRWANELTWQIGDNRTLIGDVQARIARLAGPSHRSLTEQDIDSIVGLAAPLELSANFVRNHWIPAELAKLRGQPVPVAVQSAAMAKPALAAQTTAPAVSALVLDSPGPNGAAISAKQAVADAGPSVAASLTEVSNGIGDDPVPAVRFFTATPPRIRQGESVKLAWVVETGATVMVDDLGAGLPAQHEVWIKPSKTTDYTLFDAAKKPLRTLRVEVEKTTRSRAGVYGGLVVLLALVLLYGLLRFSSPSGDVSKVGRQTDSAQPIAASSVNRPANKPREAGKAYDQAEASADDWGWRRARLDGRWGYIDKKDQWVIPPQYEAVTHFRNNKAVVFQKGHLITINRAGKLVKQ